MNLCNITYMEGASLDESSVAGEMDGGVYIGIKICVLEVHVMMET